MLLTKHSKLIILHNNFVETVSVGTDKLHKYHVQHEK